MRFIQTLSAITTMAALAAALAACGEDKPSSPSGSTSSSASSGAGGSGGNGGSGGGTGGTGGIGGSGGGSGGSGGGTGGSGGSNAYLIVPGMAVGPVQLGMQYDEVVAILGEPEQITVNSYVGLAVYGAKGLEVVVSSPEAMSVGSGAVVIAVGVTKSEGFAGSPRPGQPKDEVEMQLGAPSDAIDPFAYFEPGASARYDANGSVQASAVFVPYDNAPNPPPMAPAK